MDNGKWKYYLVGALAMALVVNGCGKKKEETAEAPMATQEQAAAPARAGMAVKGKVEEVLAGGGFTYLRVMAADGEKWIAVPETEVKVGEEVSVANGQLMENFPSKTLNRTFPQLLVAPGLEGHAAKAAGSPHGMPNGAPEAPKGAPAAGFGAAMQQEAGKAAPGGAEVMPGSAKAIVPSAAVKVDKATGSNAYTVGELFGKAASLNGKKVRVRGQVMKVSANIMGRNWVHLQDGTGDPAKNTHDLVVTTAEQAEKGKIVMMEGVLATNKDFGAGYVYSVIVEDGKLQK